MGSLARPVLCIVTPGTTAANNGNWRTAARWAAMLRGRYKIILQTRWDGTPADVLIALHARKSAADVDRFRSQCPGAGIAVVLTGTDLYHDLPDNADAIRSLEAADRIVLLQDAALAQLRPGWRRKSDVIFQSARPLAQAKKTSGTLRCVVVGHLREEKDPRTLFAAIRLVPPSLPITVLHAGAALDPRLGKAALGLARADARYRYVAALPHGLARAAIKSAHLLLHPSLLEGGANVIVEAVTSGTAVIASRVSGNVGMLGVRYPGYFEPGDASGLARRLVQAHEDRDYLRQLERQCALRRPLFSPAAERRALLALAADLISQGRR